jgi:DNA-binding response OmpR family regulator
MNKHMETDTARPKKILLAEDDQFISRAYADGLGRAGFEIITALDGVEALAHMRSEKPDLVLVDLIMPGKNGFEILEEMKADASLRNIPVIILSNLGQESDVERGKTLGAADYLIKSNLSLQEVAAAIRSHLDE